MSDVWLAYGKALLHIAGNLIIAGAIVLALRRFTSLEPSRRIQQGFILAGTLCLLTAGIGKLGWSIQSWVGTTPPESLNQGIFLTLSHLGMFFVFTEWVWSFMNPGVVDSGDSP